MHRYRRLVLIDRLIPFLAAGVGLIALIGAVTVQLNADGAAAAHDEEVTHLRVALDLLSQRVATTSVGGVAADPQLSDDVAGLNARIAALESGLKAAQDRVTQLAAGPSLSGADSASGAPLAADLGTKPATADAAPKKIDPNLPVKDCIPLGTRFMVTPNEKYPMCQSKIVLKVGAITADMVDVDGAGPITETGFGKLVGTDCTVMAFSADAEGFAELRVTCG